MVFIRISIAILILYFGIVFFIAFSIVMKGIT